MNNKLRRLNGGTAIDQYGKCRSPSENRSHFYDPRFTDGSHIRNGVRISIENM